MKWNGGRALRDPTGFCDWLNREGVVAGARADVLSVYVSLAVLEVTFQEPPDSSPLNFPTEQVHVTLKSSMEIAAVPVFSTRTWLHRYPTKLPSPNLPLESFAGGLCLWYPGDPPSLRWAWTDGVDEYLRIVQRHLWCEEYGRRFGHWPLVDAPHGDSAVGLSPRLSDVLLQGLVR
jgi:hypothetical protein